MLGIKDQILLLCDAADPVVVLHIVEQDLVGPLCELLNLITMLTLSVYLHELITYGVTLLFFHSVNRIFTGNSVGYGHNYAKINSLFELYHT